MVHLCRLLVIGVALSGLVSMGSPLAAQGEGPAPATISAYVDATNACWHFTAEGAPGEPANIHFLLAPTAPELSVTRTQTAVVFDVNGKVTIDLPFEHLISLLGTFQIGYYVETWDNLSTPVISMIHVLECAEISPPAYPLFLTPYSYWGYETPEGGSTPYQVTLASYLRTDPTSGVTSQYLFYSAPLILWESCPGIEGLLPVN